MAITVSKAAKGNAPNTGAPGPTPAPTRTVPPLNDVVTAPRGSHDGGYGPGRAEQITPRRFRRVINCCRRLPRTLKASSDDGESGLDAVIKNGARMDGADPQTRAVSAEQKVPTTYRMRSRSGE